MALYLRAVPLAVMSLLTVFLLSYSPSPDGATPDLSSPAAAGEVMVRLTPAASRLPNNMLEARLGGRIIARLSEIGFLRLGLPYDETPAEAVARLSKLPWVEYAEPNLVLKYTLLPNDPLFSGQGGYLDTIGAQAAWDISQGDSAVIVAVLDSGIQMEHEDLAGKVWNNPLEIPGNGIDEDMNGCVDDIVGCSLVTPANADPSCTGTVAGSVADDNGHGPTFVSGIIAARGHNSIGVIGVAPNVTILPVKILDCLGGGTAADASQGILYAAHAGARVANISFGADGESQTLAAAIREASGRYGMVIVAATGNEGTGIVSFPARLPEVIAVASSGTPENARARSVFSDWGPEVDVAAPGQNIISTVPANFCNQRWMCVQGDQPYALASGTSLAAPLVSGLAALIVSQTPNLSPEAVRQILRGSAEPLPDGETPNWDGAGRIRMRSALDIRRFSVGVSGLSKQ